MPKQYLSILALLSAACCAPAFAADKTKPDSIVLETKVGSVMASTGGDFQTAEVGKQLVRDESLMLNDGAKATVVYYYDNGKRKCVEEYKGPNTYVIDDDCEVAAWITSRRGIGMIVGGAVVGGLLLGGSSNDPGPISAGAR